MSRIDELIRQFCPDGVEYKPLGEVLLSVRTGLNPRNNFELNTPDAIYSYVTTKEITSDAVVFTDKTDKISTEASKIIQQRSQLERGDVLLSTIGTIGKVALVRSEPDGWNCSESVMLLKPDKGVLYSEYLWHMLRSTSMQKTFDANSAGSTMKGIRKKHLVTFEIPIPPLEVQQEIVRILDAFTELEANLQRELDARKRQYEHCRDELLNFEPETERKSFFECCDYVRGVTYSKSQEVNDDADGYSLLRANNITLGRNTLNFEDVKRISNEVKVKETQMLQAGDILMCAGSGSKEHVGKVAYVHADLDFTFGGFMAVIRCHAGVIEPRLMFHIMSGNIFRAHLQNYFSSATINNINIGIMKPFTFPVPSPEKQQETVAKLDAMTALQDNLQHQIDLTHRQYEHYRDVLLNLPRKAA